MTVFARKWSFYCVILIICVFFVRKSSSQYRSRSDDDYDDADVGRKSRDFYSEPRRSFPEDLRRAGFYNDLLDRDEDNDEDDDDDDDDDDDEDEYKRFQRSVEDSDLDDRDYDEETRNAREAVYEDLVDKAFDDDITDLDTFFDGVERAKKTHRRKFVRQAESGPPPTNITNNSTGMSPTPPGPPDLDKPTLDLSTKAPVNGTNATNTGPPTKSEKRKKKMNKMKKIKAGQKKGLQQLKAFKKKLKKKEDFMLMFKKYPAEEITWVEPRMLPQCWVQAMLAKTHDFFSPSCHADGTFAPKQCYLERCWCVKPNGKPVEDVGALRFKYHLKGLLLECAENATNPTPVTKLNG